MGSKIALGRGLEALIPTADKEEKSEGMYQSIPLDRIAPNPHQPRKSFDNDSLGELAESFKSRGMLQPILVKKEGGGFTLIVGERRFRAAKIAGLDKISALIMSDLSKNEMLEMALIENVQREDLNPIETAQAYQALIEQCGITQSALADKVGKNRASVTNTLRLLTLPDNIRQLIIEGKLTEGHARAILSVSDSNLRNKVAQKIISETMSVRQAENMARQSKRRRLVIKRKPPGIEDAETFLKHILGTAVKIVPGLKKGRIEIEYYGDEDLNRLLDMMRKLS
ncbi:MAG: ParB/RepB/Spo0J family partition protein [candidate division Zixibacteria bacterium]